LLFFSGLTSVLSGQDLHFSQFVQTPLLVNPAHTGFIPDGDFRLGVNYRNQWASVSAFPYKTMSAFGDVQLLQNSEQTGWLGLGGLLLRDVAGTSALTSTKVYGSVAYHQMIGNGSLLGLGFNVGWANKSINTSGLTFPSQWNGQFFDIHQSNLAPVLANNNINYLDMQVGLNYAYFPNPSTFLNAGFSAMHLNRPQESFFENVNGVDIPADSTLQLYADLSAPTHQELLEELIKSACTKINRALRPRYGSAYTIPFTFPASHDDDTTESLKRWTVAFAAQELLNRPGSKLEQGQRTFLQMHYEECKGELDRVAQSLDDLDMTSATTVTAATSDPVESTAGLDYGSAFGESIRTMDNGVMI
jgi:type IX secretion system PorP/SprF family membrane protein